MAAAVIVWNWRQSRALCRICMMASGLKSIGLCLCLCLWVCLCWRLWLLVPEWCFVQWCVGDQNMETGLSGLFLCVRFCVT